MSQFTYSDLLEYLGLSNWQFIFIALVIFFIYAGISTLWKVGGLGKIKVTKKVVPKFQAVYISYEGDYGDIGVIFNQAVEDFQMVFKFSSFFAIYYTHPKEMLPLSKAIIGVSVNKIEQGKIPLFLSKFPLYKRKSMPETVCLSASYPLVNGASSIMAIERVYPILDDTIKQLQIIRKHQSILEFYHTEANSPYMDIVYPIQNEDDFELWYEPTDYSRVTNQKRA